MWWRWLREGMDGDMSSCARIAGGEACTDATEEARSGRSVEASMLTR